MRYEDCMPGGQGAWANGRQVDNPDETVEAVRANVEAGVDLIKFAATGACSRRFEMAHHKGHKRRINASRRRARPEKEAQPC